MLLHEGAIFQTPDGRKMRAKSETRRYHPERAWTLSPADGSDETISTKSTRDRLSGMLFVEGDKLYRFDFEGGPQVQDTGWTVRDLVLVQLN